MTVKLTTALDQAAVQAMAINMDRLLVDKLNRLPRPEAERIYQALHDPTRRTMKRDGDWFTVFIDGEEFLTVDGYTLEGEPTEHHPECECDVCDQTTDRHLEPA